MTAELLARGGGEGCRIDGGDGGVVATIATTIAATTCAPTQRQPHPLENSWTFWFDNPSAKSKQAAWGSPIRPIYTFATVEEFWSKLAVGADFYCFKEKIEPKWEDPICANGGKWTMIFQRGKFDTSWLYTLLAMIGEQFDHGDEICGAVVNVRNRQDNVFIVEEEETGCWVRLRFIGSCISSRSKVDSSVGGTGTHYG